jgi:hypothetical protein
MPIDVKQVLADDPEDFLRPLIQTWCRGPGTRDDGGSRKPAA